MYIKIFLVTLFLVLMLVPFVVSSAFASKPDSPIDQSTSVPTSTETITPTDTPTNTPTSTATLQPTAVVTPTDTPTATSTPTPTTVVTPTDTPTATFTPTPTIVVTPTNTPTSTPTATSTSTPTSTPTPTLVPTSTPTFSPSDIAALNCWLPLGDTSMNPLGVAYNCPSMPMPIHASRSPTAIALAIKPTPTAAPTPKGDAPSSAMTISSDVLHTLDAGAVHWYRIDNGQNFYLDVWLDTSGQTGITLSIFSPEQTNALSVDSQPKGRGGPAKNDPTHDLMWSGSNANGVWYALVRNYNSSPVQYKIGTNQSGTDRTCFGYWEIDHYGKWIYWVDCGHYPGVPKP